MSFASTALAQGVSVIVGDVTDASTRRRLTEVVVTATSPKLQGEQVVVTDATGTYRIPQLPPGVYTLRFEKEAYRPYTRTGITLNADRTIRLNVELLTETVEQGETITVVGRAPTIDVGSSSISSTITRDFIDRIAVARPGGLGGPGRSFESLALTVPQAQLDAFGVSLNGTTSPENGIYVDGVQVNNPAFGVNGSPTTIEFIDEVNVITGGYMPEFGRTQSGIINAITKSGSNEFHGSVFLHYAPGALAGTPRPFNNAASSIGSIRTPWNIGDLGATLGGPIIKDKLWFFVGIEPSFQRTQITRTINQFLLQTNPDGTVATDPDTTNPIVVRGANGLPVTQEFRSLRSNQFADLRQIQYTAKLTYLINDDHRVNISFRGSPTTAGGAHSLPFALSPPALAAPFSEVTAVNGDFGALATQNIQTSHDLVASLNSSFMDKKVLLDVTLGWHNEYNATQPVDGSWLTSGSGLGNQMQYVYQRTDPTHYLGEFLPLSPDVRAICEANDGQVLANGSVPSQFRCPAAAWVAGGPGFVYRQAINSYTARAVGTYLLNAFGHHVIKAGFDSYFVQYRDTRGNTGGAILAEEPGGAPLWIATRESGYLVGPDSPVYLKQVSTSTRSTTLGGFIQDSWSIFDKVTANVGVRYDQQIIFGTDGQVGMNLPNQWSPRLGAVYDFTQQGKSKLFANYAIYYQNVPQGLTDRSLALDPQLFAYYRTPTGLPGVPGCDPRSNTFAECSDPRNVAAVARPSPSNFYFPYNTDKEVVARDIRPTSTQEVVAGFEYEVLPGGRASITYTHRNVLSWIEDMSRDNATTYFLGNPGLGSASDFPLARRDYNAVTLSFIKAWSDLWLTQVSYTYSTLYGNIDGLFRPQTLQLDPNNTTAFDVQRLTNNVGYGPLAGDIEHHIKLYGAKEFVISGRTSVSLGLTYEGYSGPPLSYLGANQAFPSYGNSEVFILPRGAAGRGPWVHQFDGRLALNFRIAKDNVLQASVDCFNLFNFQAPIALDQNYTFAGVLPVPNGTKASLPDDVLLDDGSGRHLTAAQVNRNFLQPLRYQPVRTFRFGIRFTF